MEPGGLEALGGGPNDSQSPEGADRACKSVHLAQVESAVYANNGPDVQMSLRQSESSNEARHDTPLGDPEEDQQVARTVGCATAPTQTAEGQEAASTQAVKRGHSIEIEEVPDDEDNTSFDIVKRLNRNLPQSLRWPSRR